MFDSPSHHRSLLTLSALGVSGRHWDNILWQGGPEQALDAGPSCWGAWARKGGAEDLERATQQAEEVLGFKRAGGQLIGAAGPHELGRLLRAPQPLLCAFMRGNPELLRQRPVVSIVGTRHPSPKGKERAFRYAAELGRAGVLVVSGGAMGVDLEAHRGALSAGGQTLAVLGEVLRPGGDERPWRLKELEPLKNLSTLTPFAPWVRPSRALFVARNQYVAALADALLIIEGKLDSGTLHTARYAKQIGVPVWAVPGDPDEPLSGASNSLLQEGQARALVGLGALMASLGLAHVPEAKLKQNDLSFEQKTLLAPGLTLEHPAIIQQLAAQGGRMTFDRLCETLREPAPKLQQDLLELELAGTLRRLGAEFVLTGL